MESSAGDKEKWTVYSEIVKEAKEKYRQALERNDLLSDRGDAYSEIMMSDEEIQRLTGAEEEEAIIAGLTAAEVSVVVAAIEVLVICIVAPLIYFTEKPANGVILLVNELDEKLTYESNYFIHGKETGSTDRIDGKQVCEGKVYKAVAFYTGARMSGALVGTQGAFTVKGEKGKIFSFGFDCPLTGLYVDNNCYCEIEETAEKVAEQTDKWNLQESKFKMDGYAISMKCNSKEGETAYYIVRIYKK